MSTKKLLLIALSMLAISQQSFAGFLDLFKKEPKTIVFNVDLSRKGTVVESSFKIEKKCNYGFYVKFYHNNKQWNELDNIISGMNSKDGITIPVKLEISINHGNDLVTIYNNIVETKGSSGYTNEFTERSIDFIFLEKGEYFISVEALKETKELSNINEAIEIKIRPKTSCN